jgi:hypothetical protein
MDRQNARGPVNVSAAVGAVNEDPPESLAVDSETAERERAARDVEASAESSAEQGVTESHMDQPRTGTISPDSLGSGPPD